MVVMVTEESDGSRS